MLLRPRRPAADKPPAARRPIRACAVRLRPKEPPPRRTRPLYTVAAPMRVGPCRLQISSLRFQIQVSRKPVSHIVPPPRARRSGDKSPETDRPVKVTDQFVNVLTGSSGETHILSSPSSEYAQYGSDSRIPRKPGQHPQCLRLTRRPCKRFLHGPVTPVYFSSAPAQWRRLASVVRAASYRPRMMRTAVACRCQWAECGSGNLGGKHRRLSHWGRQVPDPACRTARLQSQSQSRLGQQWRCKGQCQFGRFPGRQSGYTALGDPIAPGVRVLATNQ